MGGKGKLDSYISELLSLKASTDAIVWGFTIGALVSFTPTWGIHTLLIMGLTAALQKNFTAAYISSWIFGNPLVAFPVYALEYRIGLALTSLEPISIPSRFSFAELLALGWHFIIPAFAGCLVVAPLLAAPVHFGFKAWLRNRRRKLEGAEGN